MSQLNDIDAVQVIKVMESYINRSAESASKFYINRGIVLVPFDGIKITFTPEVCASVYRDLIFDLIKNQCAYRTKYNLSATLVMLDSKDDKVCFTIQLGMIFPMH